MLIHLPSPLLYAHRGTPLDLPENTMPGFRRALELGVPALETDVHMTRDGQVVVSHDPDGRRLAGVDAEIRSSTLAEVQSWDLGRRFVSRAGEPFAGRGFRVPLLEELLAETPGVPINIDVKQRQPDMVGPLLALLDRLGAADRVLIASFSSATLREVRRRGYPGRTALGMAEALKALTLPAAWLRRFPVGGHAAQIPTRVAWLPGIDLGHARVIARYHALGVRVEYWTINDPAAAMALWRSGADAVMTDDPAALMPAFASLAGQPAR